MSAQDTSPGVKRPAGAFAAFLHAIVRSVNPRTPTQAAIVEDEVLLTRGSSDTSDVAVPVAAALVALVCRPWIPAATLIVWVAAMALVSAGSWYIGKRIDHLRCEGVEGIRRWARMRTAMTVLFLATWCSMGIFLWAPGVLINHMLLILVLASSLALANANLAVHPATAVINVILHGSLLIPRLFFAGDPLEIGMSGLALIYCLLIATQGRVIYDNARRARQLQIEREALIRDLSEAKKESDRERAIAVKAGRTRSEFLSNMNHELRTPMNAILGFSELIKAKAFGDMVDKYTEYAGIIHDSGLHLLALINDMLDLAKIEGGKLSLRESQFGLGHLISDAASEHEVKAAERGVALSVSIERNMPQIHADERAMRQILSNLLSNAVKFTPSGGSVSVFACRAGERLAFGVKDTGIGIPREDQEQVFERFGRGRHDVATADKGTGLGLAIVKGFAEAHDGEVVLESAPGAGTCVTVYLPQTRIAAEPKKKTG